MTGILLVAYKLDYNSATIDKMAQTCRRHKIKKLTKDKIELLLPEILVGNSLDLSVRGIEAILTFEGLEKCTKVDISSNRITNLPSLSPIKNATMLKLNNNKLRSEVSNLNASKSLIDY